MNDQIVKEGFWSDPLSTWLEQATWLEWLQPVLYFVLALALASLLFALLDLVMMCWKEFHRPAQSDTQPMLLSPKNRVADTVALRFFSRS